MRLRLTTTFRQRLADKLLDLATGQTAPATASIGDGALNSAAPQDAMYHATQACTLSVTRAANDELSVLVTVPPASGATTYNEVGVFAPDGALILHATFAPQTLSAQTEASFNFTLNPEDTL